MKKLILSLLIAGACTVPSVARAESNAYVSLSGGVGLLNNSTVDGNDDAIRYDTGYLINGAIGLKNEAVRLEAEVGYHRNRVDSSDYSVVRGAHVSMWSYMANGYYDIDMDNVGLSPYIMAGLGAAHATIREGNWGSPSSATEFAWQVGAGLGIKTADNVMVDIGYRYLSPSDATFDGAKVSLASSNFIVGIRYSF